MDRLHYGCRVEPSATSWDPAWDEVAVVCLLSVAYAIASIRLGTTRWRAISFGAAMVLALAVLVTPLGTLATHYLLSAHLLQNVVLAEWAPALAVLGLSPALASRLGAIAPVRLLTRPFVALPLWVLTYALWHVPGPYEAALTEPAASSARTPDVLPGRLLPLVAGVPVAATRPFRTAPKLHISSLRFY